MKFFALLVKFSLILIFPFQVVQAYSTFGKQGLVVSASDLASQAGMQTMKAGGNVVDAAVTTAFCLAVTRPYYASIGGGGFLLLRFNGKIQALDYRERAPLKSTKDMFVKKGKDTSTVGGLAVATPGVVKGLYELHKKFGKRSWASDIAPAVKLAESGFPVTEEFSRTIAATVKNFSRGGKKYFTHDGKPVEIGETFRQPQLAAALKIIQKKGAQGFYSGEVAEDVVHTLKINDGIMTLEDLKKYGVRWLEPLHEKVFGVDVYSMPPPSSGGALLLSEMKMAEKLKLNNVKAYSADEYHLLSEMMARVFFDRQYIADPAFTKFDVKELFSDARVNKWVDSIDSGKKKEIDASRFEIKEAGNTTHYVVVDRNGNAVTATTTVNTDFGSGVFTDKFGINLNNEMDDFTTHPGEPNAFGLMQSDLNSVAPGKTPLSSMTPTIVEKNGKLLEALGSPGGPRIINTVFQTLLHSLTTTLSMDEIVQAPRVHHQYNPDKIFYDRTLSPEVVSDLESKGHVMAVRSIGKAYAIRITPDGLLEGAYDNRGEGGASGF